MLPNKAHHPLTIIKPNTETDFIGEIGRVLAPYLIKTHFTQDEILRDEGEAAIYIFGVYPWPVLFFDKEEDGIWQVKPNVA